MCDYTSAVTRFDPHGQGLSVAFAQFRGQDYVQGILDTGCSFDTVGELALKEIERHVRGSLRKGEKLPSAAFTTRRSNCIAKFGSGTSRALYDVAMPEGNSQMILGISCGSQ